MHFMAPATRIGTRIRRAMERKRMNQFELAEALGVSRSAVNAWINDRAWPRGSIGALEEILDIRLDDAAEPQPLSEEEREGLTQEYKRLGRILFGSEQGGSGGSSADGAEGSREGNARSEGRSA